MRALKFAGFLLGGLVVLIALALIGVRLFVDPNDYKDRIARAVRDSTGRELALPGEIRLSVFPWIALELGPASLGNPPGFGAGPFAAVKHAALRVKLLPLLHRQLQVGRIEITGLDLRLYRNASGEGNWEDFGGGKAAPASPGAGAGTLQELAGVLITDSRVSYQDMVAGQLNLEVGRVSSGAATPVKLKLNLLTGPGARPLALAGRFDVTPDLAGRRYRFAPLELDGALSLAGGAAPVPWKFAAPELAVDLAAQTLSAPAFSAQLGAARLSGALQARKILDAPSLGGTFKLAPVALRELLGQLGISLPKMRDAHALGSLAASGELAYGGKALRATQLDVRLDDSVLRGNAGLTNLDTRAMSFDLAIDRIDLDRYRSPEQTGVKQPAGTQGPQADPLQTLRMKGALSLDSAKVAGVALSQVRLEVVAADGVIHIAPARARLYGGNYTGDITLDDRGAVPALRLSQTMAGVDLAQLLRDFAGSGRLSGRGTVSSNLTARGRGGEALLKSLDGHVAASIDDGAIEGLDLWFEINRALAVVQNQTLPAARSSGRTRFDTCKASADLAEGVATTRDLNIASQNLRVTGEGTMNLVSGALDYRVKATVLRQPGSAAAGTLADVPVTVSGTLGAPKVRPDVEGMAKARLQQEVEKHKQELQQKLQEKLQDLLKGK
ncbi:MAG TPA: AsmA family protein [Steroidobacteraceae bacterium]|nr:AsmA family protein [Steroidobacteraceae bacterium]